MGNKVLPLTIQTFWQCSGYKQQDESDAEQKGHMKCLISDILGKNEELLGALKNPCAASLNKNYSQRATYTFPILFEPKAKEIDQSPLHFVSFDYDSTSMKVHEQVRQGLVDRETEKTFNESLVMSIQSLAYENQICPYLTLSYHFRRFV